MRTEHFLIIVIYILAFILITELILQNSIVIKTSESDASREIDYELYERSFRKEDDPKPKIKKTPFFYEPEEDFLSEFPGSPFE